MRGEDTVLTDKEIANELRKFSDDEWLEIIKGMSGFQRKLQAEISYKVGEEEGYNRGLSLLVKEEESMCSRARQGGRQEVVDYLWDYTEFEHKGCDDDCNLQNVATIHIDWEEFKKDMGIKQ